ncbi:MAG TPA: hypothetical protein VGL91_24910 [Acidobacteriota bacterium]|jgi:hypothetical protein
MPKPEQVDRAIQEIAKGYAQYQYFFDRLISPAWIEPLAEKGLFKHPPAPSIEDQSVTFAWWPESHYLARMAKIPAAQQSILKVVLSIPETENIRVNDDLAEIALSLPAEMSAQLVPKMIKWLDGPYRPLFPKKPSQLVVHLANAKRGAEALQLTRSLLALFADSRPADGLFPPDPRSRFELWYYEEIIDTVTQSLVSASGIDAVKLFCDLLEQAITLSRNDSDDGQEDYLYISHPAIEEGAPLHQLSSLLICAVRDAAEYLVRLDNATFQQVLTVLNERKWPTFIRIQLHLCRVFPELGLPTAQQFFEKPDILDRPSLSHEAVLLLKTTFRNLRSDLQERFFQWVDQGLPAYFRDGLVKEGASPDEINDYENQWRRDRLALIEDQLTPEVATKYEYLLKQRSVSRHLEKPRRTTGGAFAPPSPRPSEELERMSINDILDYLAAWKPSGGILEANREGLGRNISKVVLQRPLEFSRQALEFKTLDPTYVRHLFEGLITAVKDHKEFDWAPVLDLADWIVQQPRHIPGRKGDYFVQDADWAWTRSSILELIDVGFREATSGLPFADRMKIWKILEALTLDDDPTSEQEKEDEHFDPASLSLNSIRCRALDRVIAYALWSKEDLKRQLKDETRAEISFDDMPEVRRVLEAHLDPSIDSSLAVRSLYGRELRRLAYLDWEWVKRNVEKIFDWNNEAVFRAAWESYVVFNQPHSDLLKALRTVHRHAVAQLGNVPSRMRHPSILDDSLGEHLVIYYWQGRLGFDENDRLLEEFFLRASDERRAHVIWFIGHAAAEWIENPPPEVIERLQALFEWRLTIAEKAHQDVNSSTPFSKELANFGSGLHPGDSILPGVLESLVASSR